MPLVTPGITSPSNPKIKRLVRLKERRHRDAEGVFLVEGREMIRALEAGLQPVEVYGPSSASGEMPIPVQTASGPALAKASYRSDPGATIGVFAQFEKAQDQVSLKRPNPLVLVMESLEKPGNMGAILRTADAVDADLVLAPVDFDLFNPNVVRASTGALFSVPVLRLPPERAISFLRSRDIRIVAGHPSGGSAPWELDLTGPLALVVGDEHAGLSGQMHTEADHIATIPMQGSITDSLNSSVSAAILAFEALRQRTAPSP